ncbi:MAG: response regulator transcription factor [Alphaproteobacteria bacterium]
MRILLIEDDERIVEFVRRGLQAEGYRVTVTGDGARARDLAAHDGWSVIILDIMLPGHDGRDLCRAMREAGIVTPILMLTALDSLDDRVAGLRLGADDYLAKPFSFAELLARIEALIRRAGRYQATDPISKIDDLSIDRERKQVRRGARAIELTPREFALLDCLLAEPGKVFSRTMILERVWGYTSDPLTNVVEVYIRQLRKKIDIDGDEPLILTVRGFGYKIRDA